MLDKPEQTARLLATLKAAVPFAVMPTPEMIAHLAGQDKPVLIKASETVFDVSYLGDEGGIMCHIRVAGSDARVLVSLTHVRVAHALPSRRRSSPIRSTA